MAEKFDFKKELAQLYAPKNKDWELVDVPIMNFLMVDGEGDPNTARDYSDAVEALYALAYAIKFLAGKGLAETTSSHPLRGCGPPAILRSLRMLKRMSTSGR
jgi:hypothetical protein